MTTSKFSLHLQQQLTRAELVSALMEADQRERAYHPQGHAWAVDIGFAHSPGSVWLSWVVLDVMAGDDRDEQRLMDVLERDQRRLIQGWRPGHLELVDAPIITPDTVLMTSKADDQIINLAGHVRKVPGGGPDRRRITSPVIAFDAARFEWVRTLSRFYRLEWNAAQPVQKWIASTERGTTR
jgi:hypothetical protein